MRKILVFLITIFIISCAANVGIGEHLVEHWLGSCIYGNLNCDDFQLEENKIKKDELFRQAVLNDIFKKKNIIIDKYGDLNTFIKNIEDKYRIDFKITSDSVSQKLKEIEQQEKKNIFSKINDIENIDSVENKEQIKDSKIIVKRDFVPDDLRYIAYKLSNSEKLTFEEMEVYRTNRQKVQEYKNEYVKLKNELIFGID